jgi:hypothetical protein
MNVPIPFYYFIGSTDETKKYIDLKNTTPSKTETARVHEHQRRTGEEG